MIAQILSRDHLYAIICTGILLVHQLRNTPQHSATSFPNSLGPAEMVYTIAPFFETYTLFPHPTCTRTTLEVRRSRPRLQNPPGNHSAPRSKYLPKVTRSSYPFKFTRNFPPEMAIPKSSSRKERGIWKCAIEIWEVIKSNGHSNALRVQNRTILPTG